MIFRRYWLLIFFLPNWALAQEEEGVPKIVLHDREHVYHLGFQTNGWGIGTDWFLKGKDAYTFWKLGADVQFYRHEKEVKSFSQDPQARAYYYGKQNSFFLFRPGIGMNHEFAEKLRKSGVQISYFWTVGPDIGLVKPVYLQILTPSNIPGRYNVTAEKFDPNEHYIDNIYGRAPNLMGLNETKIQLGLFFKGGFRFEYSSHDTNMKGMEIGLSADLFPKRIEIMSQEVLDRYHDHAKNHFLFLAPYVKFFFGNKYDRK
jgi:hypothetical protein